MENLSEEDRVRIGLQVDLVIETMARRYGLEPREVVEAVRWVQTHKEFVSRLKHGGVLSLMGVLITASLLALWEGAKAYFRKST